MKEEQVRWVQQLADYLLLPTDSLPPFSLPFLAEVRFNPRPPLLNPNTHRADPLLSTIAPFIDIFAQTPLFQHQI